MYMYMPHYNTNLPASRRASKWQQSYTAWALRSSASLASSLISFNVALQSSILYSETQNHLYMRKKARYTPRAVTVEPLITVTPLQQPPPYNSQNAIPQHWPLYNSKPLYNSHLRITAKMPFPNSGRYRGVPL